MVDKAQSEKISASVKALAIFQSRELSRWPKFSQIQVEGVYNFSA
jgi:hypothetical protein